MKKETAHDRFVRLATKRTNAILDKLRVLGNCSNRSAYSYTEEDIDKIFSAIERELKDVKSKFQTVRSRKFTLVP